MCISRPDEYPLNEGRLTSNRGIDVPISEYDRVLEEHAAIKHRCTRAWSGVARRTWDRSRATRSITNCSTPRPKRPRSAPGWGPWRNPFQSILVRMVEIAYAVEEALRLIEIYDEPDAPAVPVEPRAGTGYGATEAPRGICYQRYTTNDAGIITDCKIVAPTSVNQAVIEEDLFAFASDRTDLSDEQLRWQCEQAIRNYDPCISCATHFLDLEVRRC